VLTNGLNALNLRNTVQIIPLNLPYLKCGVLTGADDLFKLIVVVDEYCISDAIVVTEKGAGGLVGGKFL